MLALCVPSPGGWRVDSCGNYAPANEGVYDELKKAVPDLPPAPLTFNPCDPAILNLQGYAQKNFVIIPHLEEQEAQKVQRGQVLCYNFQTLKPEFVSTKTLTAARLEKTLVQLPRFQLEPFLYNQEIYGAALRAQEPIFIPGPASPASQEEYQKVSAILRDFSHVRPQALEQEQRLDEVVFALDLFRLHSKPQPVPDERFIRSLLPPPPKKVLAFGYTFV